jgi:hypothetical protein
VEYTYATDDQALAAFMKLARLDARFTTSSAGARSILTSTTPATSSPPVAGGGRLGGFHGRHRGGRGRGLKFPLLIRFQDILRHRVEAINQAFRNSIAEFNYQGKYRGVFPIKVNQLREVVEEILDAGKPLISGWRSAASRSCSPGWRCKTTGQPHHLQRLQGRGIHPMALLGIKLGKAVIMVVEKLEELRQIIAISKAARRGTADRHPRAPVEQGRRQMGRERRRKREVRPEHRGTPGRHGNAAGRKPGHIASSCCIFTSARRCRIF